MSAVSVIVIFLNGEPFLEDAVESVFAQTLQDWELVLVDDGSSDASSDRARGHAERHPDRVRYLEHPGRANLGMSASRNLGLRASHGRYVAFLDADDVWRADKLERQVAILESTPRAVMVQGAPLMWYGWTGRPEDAARDRVADLPAPPGSLVDPPDLLLRALDRSAPSTWPSDALVRREAIEAAGGFEDVFRGMYEDQAFFAKLLLRGAAFVSGESWLRYRQHDGSCYATSKRTGQGYDARRFYLTWLRGYLARQELVDPRVIRVLEQELRPYRLSTRLVRRVRQAVRRVATSVRDVARGGPQRPHPAPARPGDGVDASPGGTV